jgi:hypothetical protein
MTTKLLIWNCPFCGLQVPKTEIGVRPPHVCTNLLSKEDLTQKLPKADEVVSGVIQMVPPGRVLK